MNWGHCGCFYSKYVESIKTLAWLIESFEIAHLELLLQWKSLLLFSQKLIPFFDHIDILELCIFYRKNFSITKPNDRFFCIRNQYWGFVCVFWIMHMARNGFSVGGITFSTFQHNLDKIQARFSYLNDVLIIISIKYTRIEFIRAFRVFCGLSVVFIAFLCSCKAISIKPGIGLSFRKWRGLENTFWC